jgi:hypothetical protein
MAAAKVQEGNMTDAELSACAKENGLNLSKHSAEKLLGKISDSPRSKSLSKFFPVIYVAYNESREVRFVL